LFFTAALKRLKDDDESEEEETIVADAGGCGVRSSAATKVMCERAPVGFFFKKRRNFAFCATNFGGHHLSEKIKKNSCALGCEGRWLLGRAQRARREREKRERQKISTIKL
jgi:hypothetical protein